MVKKIKNILKDNRGETFTETLVAIMIAAIASTIILGMVVAGRNIIRNSDLAVENFYKKERIMNTAMVGEQAYEIDGFYENIGTVTLKRTGEADEDKTVKIITCPEYDFIGFYVEWGGWYEIK